MTKYIINGGKILRGDVTVSGAKNAVLPILSAAILNQGVTRLLNCPDISDVRITIEILKGLGCDVQFIKNDRGNTIEINASHINCTKIGAENACKCRSSVTFLGALIARMGEAEVAYPGGCTIGTRPLDIHEAALSAMNIKVKNCENYVRADKKEEEEHCDRHIFLRFPSVGATENAMLAAAGTSETVFIYGAAMEPEIVCLADYLTAIGAEIEGAGTNAIRIKGKTEYKADQVNFTVIPDRIEAATYLMAAAAAGVNVKIHGCNPLHIAPVIKTLRSMGCEIKEHFYSAGNGRDAAMELVKGAVYGRLESPGFVIAETYPAYPTDAQSIILPLLATAKGNTFVSDRIFPERFGAAEELRKMGADIEQKESGQIVKGKRRLKGTDVYSRDLRAGAAMIIAGLSASGRTTIYDNGYIQRGYDAITQKLRGLGAEIWETNY
ncbi:MAG: UDP-N-acetylglucosamine 1-carboxyvinyltransferase [Clostridia bacterium]